MIKNPPASAGDVRDSGLISGSEKPLGEGHSNPLQFACLGNPMDSEAWQAMVYSCKSWT